MSRISYSEGLRYSSAPDNKAEAPSWLWLVFPLAMIAASLILRTVSPDFYFAYIEGELGVVENGTVLLLLPAVLSGLIALYYSSRLGNKLLTALIVINTLGCFYFMGEEASWGQHWFGWNADGVFVNNPRGETNIHNTNHWFDQKPKVLIEIWTIVGGIFAPIWFWWRARSPNQTKNIIQNGSQTVPSIWYWAWPTYVCIPTAVIALIIKNIERARQSLGTEFPVPFDIRFSEPQEYYFGLFLLLYMLSLCLRVRQASKGT